LSDYVPLPHERTTEPRWRCLITGNVEYAKPRDRSADAAKRRLAKSCRCLHPDRHVYRAGFIPAPREPYAL
jgi:hypothetical protein